ncbi:hypothetical protein NET03_09640 [Thermomicrobium sp. CFH 73360]|uniref:hypothetical protein n=1 Tax=Thermomicrobium sp. CFH 73360 TaxID=2951987 RepID=UPI0020776781|nr:hypothetical protein [Thermomicrobium sp. CFH 73360]MCM8746786.1 hypothetical protein [Thermomicrobium sp. CFH 73360]
MTETRRERLVRQEAARQARVWEEYQAHLRRYEAWAVAEERLRALVPKALDVVERTLDDPAQGPKVALALLRAAGLWGLEPVSKPSLRLYQLSADLEDFSLASWDRPAVAQVRGVDRTPRATSRQTVGLDAAEGAADDEQTGAADRTGQA